MIGKLGSVADVLFRIEVMSIYHHKCCFCAQLFLLYAIMTIVSATRTMYMNLGFLRVFLNFRVSDLWVKPKALVSLNVFAFESKN